MVLYLANKAYEILYKNLIRRFGIYNKQGKNLILFIDILISKSVVKEVLVNHSSKIPTKPVEGGGFINDSRINEPKTISFTAQIRANELELGNIINTLRRAKSGIELFDVVLPSGVYENMALVSFEEPYKNVKNFMEIPLQFQEVVIVKPRYANIENPKNPINSNTSNNGRVQAEKVTEQKKQSLAVKFFGGK